MTPYLSFLLSPFVELLRGSDDQEDEDPCRPAQLCVVQTLTKSMTVDEGGPSVALTLSDVQADTIHFSLSIAFWRDDRLQQVTPVLVALVGLAGGEHDAMHGSHASGGSGREIVSAGLVALCDTATDDALLKRLNLDVLMHTRADEVHVRIFALQCAQALWTAHGSKLIGACGFHGKYLSHRECSHYY
jgi:U3 small nucleolar RNA-associated protein 10